MISDHDIFIVNISLPIGEGKMGYGGTLSRQLLEDKKLYALIPKVGVGVVACIYSDHSTRVYEFFMVGWR